MTGQLTPNCQVQGVTFSQHVASILMAADITIGNALRKQMQRLMFIGWSDCKNMACFDFYHVFC